MMKGETDPAILISQMHPVLNEDRYVFCHCSHLQHIPVNDLLYLFKEAEGFTVVLKKETADKLQLPYNYVAAWITLTIHSSLEAVGLTAAFSNALAQAGISSNVVAAFYHDHIFVNIADADKAIAVLNALAGKA